MYKALMFQAISELENKLIEREELIRLSLLCIFAKHHMFLIGVPGVGKTYAIQIISKIIEDGKYWEKLLTKETKESDLVGESINQEYLEKHIDETILNKDFIFFDEMFKATDELLVSFLGLLNERNWSVEGRLIKVPLNSLFSASNELPFGEKIEPFSDRLLVWYEVPRIQSNVNREKYIKKQFSRTKELGVKFTKKNIEEVNKLAENIQVSDSIVKLYMELQDTIIGNNIKASDRKFGPDFILKALQVSAVLNDRQEVDYSDLLLIKHFSWTDYTERNKLNEVLCEVIFGKTSKIESQILEIEKYYAQCFANYERNAFKFVNNNEQIDNNNEYLYYRGLIETFYNQINECLAEIGRLFSQYDFCNMVITQAKNNILCWNYNTGFPFSPSIIEKMEEMENRTLLEKSQIEAFIDKNPDMFTYQKNYFAKFKGEKK